MVNILKNLKLRLGSGKKAKTFRALSSRQSFLETDLGSAERHLLSAKATNEDLSYWKEEVKERRLKLQKVKKAKQKLFTNSKKFKKKKYWK